MLFGRGIRGTNQQSKITIDEGQREDEAEFELTDANVKVEDKTRLEGGFGEEIDVVFTNYERIQAAFKERLFAVDVA